jgi:environmental stress-induced protein Ves
VNVVKLADCPFVPWRNGGGRTRELLAWPDPIDWLVRVSVADIEADGPFSPFAGVERAIALLDGAGIVLDLPGGEQHLRPGDNAIVFDGEAAPMCRLIDGPTRDLNLMVRRDAGRALLRHTPIPHGPGWHAVFTGDALYWSDRAVEYLPLNTVRWWLALEAR